MPSITKDEQELDRWEQRIFEEARREERTGFHVSDLQLCLRKTVLSRRYEPEWSFVTLLRFIMGRALEKEAGRILLPEKHSGARGFTGSRRYRRAFAGAY